MTAAIVLDCSITMAWCFTDERTALTDQVRDQLGRTRGVVPTLWSLEVANVLAIAERRGRITQELSTGFLDVLRTMDFEVGGEGASHAFNLILPLSRRHDLTTYDATYLELALRRKLPLATLDQRLRHAAASQGLELLGA